MLFGKKKKQLEMPELPPPPSPPGLGPPSSDLAPAIPESSLDIPELPAPPDFEHDDSTIDLPEAPSPELPQPEEVYAPIVPEPMEEIHDVPVFEKEETVRKPVGPAFVSVDEYRIIMDSSNRVRAKLSEAEDYMHRLTEIKSEEDKLFDKWRAQLEDVERKLGNIDRVIAKAKR